MMPFQHSITFYREQARKAIPQVVSASFLGIIICCGCSVDTDIGRESMRQPVSPFLDISVDLLPELQKTDQSNSSELSGSKLIAVTDMPSPGRTNAFELSNDFQPEAAIQESSGKREIYVIGFVEVDNPSVMLSIDGRTQVVKAGESFERITVLEIAPPRARLSFDGVSWNASIFDRRNSTNEVTRKKTIEPPR